MAKPRLSSCLTILFFLSTSVLLSHSQTDISVKEVVEKNVQAAGGIEKLSEVKSYSFRYGTTNYYMSADGLMKLTEGKEPVITEVILVDKKKVRRNCFNNVTELAGLQKATYQCLAKLRSGLFTLINFKDQLEFQGLKTFGPKEHYVLTTNIGDLEVQFYLDSDEFMIKRLVLKGFNPSRGKYEINHDIGPYQEINGLKIPSSWFGSQVGTRGRLYEIREVKLNQDLEKDFFSKLEVNVGKVEIGEGALNGNIVEFGYRRNMLLIGTNWTNKCIQGAGFKTKDKLILQVSDVELEIEFYESFPPTDTIRPGSKFMVPNQRSENYLIYLVGQENKELTEKLEPLMPIQVKKSK